MVDMVVKKFNNKGFTLVELLGVIVVLLLVLLVAIPSVTSTFERNKNKIDEQKRQVILSAAEIYVSKNKGMLDYNSFFSGYCGVSVSEIKGQELLTSDELMNSENTALIVEYEDGTIVEAADATIMYDVSTKKFKFSKIPSYCSL